MKKLILVLFSGLSIIGCASPSQRPVDSRLPNQVTGNFGKTIATANKSITCYLSKKDLNTMVFDASIDKQSKSVGISIFNFRDTSEKLRFDDVSMDMPTKNDIVFAAASPEGSVVTLSIDVDRRKDDHTGALIVRNSKKFVTQTLVECDLK